MIPKPPVLLCVANFPTNTGFAWTFIEGLYAAVGNRLASEGVQTLVAYPSIPAPPDSLQGSACEALELSLVPESPSGLLRLLGTIRRLGARTIWFTDRQTWHWTYPLLRLAGVKRIVVHDHTSGERTTPSPLRRTVKWLVARLPFVTADLVVTVSDYVARRQREVAMTPPDRVRRIWNGLTIPRKEITPERCGFPAARTLILCACRATPEKGVADLLAAFDRLPRDPARPAESPILLYAGNGPQLEDLERIRREMAHGDDVRFLGYRPDVPQLMAGADLCVIPSVWQDAFPLAVLEAMAMGKPIVATAVGGIPEMIDSQEVGLLVPPSDPDRLAAAIQRLLADPAERKGMGIASKRRVAETFRREDQISALIACLRPGLGS